MLRSVIFIALTISFCSLLNKSFYKAQELLDIDKPIDAEILIVEAWVPDYFAGKVIEEFRSKNYKKLLFTGNKKFDYFSLWQNGSIFISPTCNQNTNDSVCQVCILAKGTPVKKQYPIIEVFLNSVKVDVFNANPDLSWHCTKMLPLKDQTIIEYRFINDCVSKHEDRNFFFNSIKLNGTLIPYTSDIISVTNNNLFNVLTANYISDASENSFLRKNGGIPIDYIAVTQADTTILSRTLSSSSAALEWMKKHHYSSANIFTLDIHSRRSFMSYKKLKNEGILIGVISEPSKSYFGGRIILKEFGKTIALSFLPRLYIQRKFQKAGLISSNY